MENVSFDWIFDIFRLISSVLLLEIILTNIYLNNLIKERFTIFFFQQNKKPDKCHFCTRYLESLSLKIAVMLQFKIKLNHSLHLNFKSKLSSLKMFSDKTGRQPFLASSSLTELLSCYVFVSVKSNLATLAKFISNFPSNSLLFRPGVFLLP